MVSSLLALEHEVEEFAFSLKVEGKIRRLVLEVGRSSARFLFAHAVFHASVVLTGKWDKQDLSPLA